MARAARDTRLETRTSRLKLEVGKRYFLAMAEGLSLMYRRTLDGYGTWSVRVVDQEGHERLHKISAADDHLDADGEKVLNFTQAQARCRALAKDIRATASGKPITVQEAAEHYMRWFRQHRKAVRATESTIKTHILPTMGSRLVNELSTREIRGWHHKLAETPARKRTAKDAQAPAYRGQPLSDDQRRARKSTANRILTVLKAILNRAYQDELVGDDTGWRRVKPFENADEPIIRFLTEAESVRLVNACDPDLRTLVKAALFTGARFGELARLKMCDFNPNTGMVFIRPESKSGKGRYIPLSLEGRDFFSTLVAGQSGQSICFTRVDGRPWGQNHHVRPLAKACKNGRIDPAIAFHELRHTYASTLAQMGVDLLSISKLLGHADTRITSRHYAHLCDQTLKQAVTKLPAFGHQTDAKVVSIS